MKNGYDIKKVLLAINNLNREIELRKTNLYYNDDIRLTPSEFKREYMRIENLTMKRDLKLDVLNDLRLDEKASNNLNKAYNIFMIIQVILIIIGILTELYY